MRLTEKYKPKGLADLWGQSWVADQLRAWLECPVPTAFLFAGGTGTGKTSAALVLAGELGVAVAEGEFGGLHQISSGEQTGQTVREAMKRVSLRPFLGSGWHVLIVNEADAMTPNAAFVWLDALETLPSRTVVVFTTNAAGKLPRRLVDRCERFDFLSGAMLLRPDLDSFAGMVWHNETGRDDCPDIDTLGPVADENGDASFRRLLQNLEPAVRAAKSGIAARPAVNPNPSTLPIRGRSDAARKAWATRRANKERKVTCG